MVSDGLDGSVQQTVVAEETNLRDHFLTVFVNQYGCREYTLTLVTYYISVITGNFKLYPGSRAAYLSTQLLSSRDPSDNRWSRDDMEASVL